MFIVLTSHKAYCEDKLEAINKKLDAKFNLEEFKMCGPDYVLQLDDVDLEFVRDKKRMSSIFFGNFFKRDKKPMLFALIAAATGLINMIIASNILTMLQSFIKACGG